MSFERWVSRYFLEHLAAVFFGKVKVQKDQIRVTGIDVLAPVIQVIQGVQWSTRAGAER
jgi:hypothetical protein